MRRLRRRLMLRPQGCRKIRQHSRLHFALWTLDFGLRTLDSGFRTLDSGPRTLDFGLRTPTACMKLEQRLAYSLGDKPPHFRFLMEFHFPLGRMDVDVHRCRRDFEEQAADRVAALH